MSRFRSDPRRQGTLLAVGKRSFAWAKAGSSSEPQELRSACLDDNLHALQAVLDELDREPIRWIFGMEQMPQWLQIPAAGARHLEELRTATLAQARSRLGHAPGADNEWIIDGQWLPGRPFSCRALTSKILSLMGARPKVTSALDTALSLIDQQVRGQWYCLSMSHEAHLVFFKSGQCSYLRSLRLSPGQPTEDLAALVRKEWRRDAIRANLTSDTLRWLHLSACDLPILPGDLVWANEPLQKHLGEHNKHPNASEDAEVLIRMALALQAWEKRR